jgi:PAS domain S-box-containing protein
MKKVLRSNRTALLLSLLYFVPAAFWILFADNILFEIPSTSEAKRVQRIDMIKDGSFVIGITVMIFFLTRLWRKRLHQTRSQYEKMFLSHPQPMWIYEIANLKFRAVNDEAIRQYGYTREEFLSLSLKHIRPPEEVPLLKEYMKSYTYGVDRVGLWNHRKKNGEIIIVEVSANDVDFFGAACRLVCATDVTEKTKKENDIRKLSLVAENATNSVIILDANSLIEWVNTSFTRLTGYTFAEVVGQRPSSFLHGPETDHHVLDQIMQNVQSGKPFSGEILNYRKDGSTFWLRLTVSPVLTKGKITNYVTVQTDITAIKEQNNRLRDIAFTASHGFRKPLANILGLVSIIDETDNQQAVIADLKRSAEELDKEVKVIVQKTAMIGKTA